MSVCEWEGLKCPRTTSVLSKRLNSENTCIDHGVIPQNKHDNVSMEMIVPVFEEAVRAWW